jgi:hypothetical protein
MPNPSARFFALGAVVVAPQGLYLDGNLHHPNGITPVMIGHIVRNVVAARLVSDNITTGVVNDIVSVTETVASPALADRRHDHAKRYHCWHLNCYHHHIQQ